MKIKSKIKKNNENKNSIKKELLDDEKANFSIIISSLLLISFLLLSIIALNTAIEHSNENNEIMSSNQYHYIMNDYIRNIPTLEREALEELSDDVIKNKRPSLDSKGDLKEMVKGLGLVPKEEAESQDLCFVPNGGVGDFVAERRPALRRSGWIVDTAGKRLGRHDGAFQYTPGQRRGLGLGGGPWFVMRTDMATNTVVVAHREELGVTTLRVNGMNWLTEPRWPVACVAQVRYLMKPREATIHPDGTVAFTEPLEAAPPGQLCVFYDGDQVLGSGWIDRFLEI